MSSRSDPKTVAVRGGMWEIAHMTKSVKGQDRGRLSINGVEKGETYLVQTLPNGGWMITPALKVVEPKVGRTWSCPKKGLRQHLDDLADAGFTFEKHTFPNATAWKPE